MKRVKVERGIDQSGACDVNGRLPAESNSMKGVAAASDVHELPKEMNGMRIRGDGNDDHVSSVMVFLAYNIYFLVKISSLLY